MPINTKSKLSLIKKCSTITYILQLLRPEEVEMLVCGDPSLDIEALQRVTIYDGFTNNDPVIRYVI